MIRGEVMDKEQTLKIEDIIELLKNHHLLKDAEILEYEISIAYKDDDTDEVKTLDIYS